MATTHPYITSGGPIVQIINHLRRSLPATIDAGTVRRLGIAPKNESYLINILRFVGIIDDEGKRTPEATKVFSVHDDTKFQVELGGLVKNAYKQLFDDHGDAAWQLDTNALITFFRQTDESSGIVGARQATTFKALAALAGHGEAPTVRTSGTRKAREPKAAQSKSKTRAATSEQRAESSVLTKEAAAGQFGLTVRVEVNLPAEADQETYDKIFQSIRRNLINGQ